MRILFTGKRLFVCLRIDFVLFMSVQNILGMLQSFPVSKESEDGPRRNFMIKDFMARASNSAYFH